MTADDGPVPEPAMDAQNVRERAARGAVLVAGRTVILRVIGLLGNVVLARLLSPSDFGIVAVGFVLITAGTVLTDSGLGAALVRGPVPDREDYGTVVGYQLLAAFAIVAVVAVVTALLGDNALVTLVMVLSLPLLAVRAPGAISLERELRYGPLVRVDVIETLAFNIWAIATVAAGFGVWGLASAVLVKSVLGTIVLYRVAPIGVVRPRLSRARLRPLLRFGLQYQAVAVSAMGRDQGINIIVGSMGGLRSLGLWSLAYRMQNPAFLVFEAMRRVSYPGMARLTELGEDVRALLSRTLQLSSFGSSYILAPLAGAAPALVPLVFGARWSDASDAITFGVVSMTLTGPLSVAAVGYLFAQGHAGEVLRASLTQTGAQFVATIALFPALGVTAVGLGMCANALVGLLLYYRIFRRQVPGFNMIGILGPSVAIATAASVGSWLVARQAATVPSAIVAMAVAVGILLAGHCAVDRQRLRDVVVTLRRAVRRRPVPTVAGASSA